MPVPTRRIGDATVSAVGLGCMPLSFAEMLGHRERALQVIHCALDAGITLLDTANVYAPSWNAIGHNEELVAEALRCYTGPARLDDVIVATKGGITREPGEIWGRDSSPSALRAACEASLRALDVSVIDLYQHHRHDPVYSYADQVRTLAALRDAGLVRRIGLSNCTLAELEIALDLVGGPDDGGIVSVQNEWSPRYRGDRDVLQRCSELGIAFLPWSPLGGSTQARDVGSRYLEFSAIADECQASPQEVVLAWLLGTTPVMVPIPGATKPATVDSIVRACRLELTPEQLTRLDATVPAMQSMYPDDLPRSPLL